MSLGLQFDHKMLKGSWEIEEGRVCHGKWVPLARLSMSFMRSRLRKTELWCGGFDNDVGLVRGLWFIFLFSVLLSYVVALLAANVVVLEVSINSQHNKLYIAFVLIMFKFIVIKNNITFNKIINFNVKCWQLKFYSNHQYSIKVLYFETISLTKLQTFFIFLLTKIVNSFVTHNYWSPS